MSISLNHHTGSDWLVLRQIAEEAVETACAGRRLPEVALNGAGMFVAGGPNGDNGTTGKKLVIDAYGPTVPIGGGAWSGKDFNKVDRAGGFLAREIAMEVMRERGEEVLVTLCYEPGGAGPGAVRVEVGELGRSGRGVVDVDASVGAADARFATHAASKRLRAAVGGIPLTDVARWGTAFSMLRQSDRVAGNRCGVGRVGEQAAV